MTLGLATLSLIGGLIILVWCSDRMVDGAEGIARILGVPSFVVGLTIVAYGTSLPEFVVSLLSAHRGVADFAVGNIVGSNIANIGLVFGVVLVLARIAMPEVKLVRRDFSFLAVATAIGVLTLLDGEVGRLDGALLFFLAVVFTWVCLRTPGVEDSDDEEGLSGFKSSGLLVLGLSGLVAGAHFMVDGGTVIARHFGIGERIIGLTIVALGTSLPELAASLAAVRKGNAGLAVGNVVGSCLFNLAFVMGASSMIQPLAVDVGAMTWDLCAMVGLTIAMWLMLAGARQTKRRDGVLLVSFYTGFMLYLAQTTLAS